MAKSVQNPVAYKEELKLAVKRFVALNLARNVSAAMDNDDLDGIALHVGDLVMRTAEEGMNELSDMFRTFDETKGVKIDG